MKGRLRWALAGVVGTLLVASPLAFGAGSSLVGGKRNPAHGAQKKTTSLVSSNSKYGLSVSSRATSGGDLVLTCRSKDGGTPAGQEPCLRALNSSAGRAFEFAFNGTLGGIFQVGPDINQPFPGAKPFITNATGVATGLNADRVDSLSAQDIITAAVDRASVKVGAQGPQGPQGQPGTQGPKGPQGVQGPPGTPLFTAKSTALNAGQSNKPVVALANAALDSGLPAASTDGTALVDPIDLDPGTFVVSVNLRAYDLDTANTADDPAYAVAAVFVDGTAKGSVTTPQIPSDGDNAAQSAMTIVVTAPVGGATLDLQGVVRTSAAVPVTGANAYGNADVVITQVNPPTNP
jgi:hypothetical protein